MSILFTEVIDVMKIYRPVNNVCFYGKVPSISLATAINVGINVTSAY